MYSINACIAKVNICMKNIIYFIWLHMFLATTKSCYAKNNSRKRLSQTAPTKTKESYYQPLRDVTVFSVLVYTFP